MEEGGRVQGVGGRREREKGRREWEGRVEEGGRERGRTS